MFRETEGGAVSDKASQATWPAMSFAEADRILTRPGAYFELEEVTINSIRTKHWKNALGTLRDAFLAGCAYGDKTFLVFEDERVTFEGFANAARTFASALVARGVLKGDRIAIAMRNLPEWPVAFYGAMLTGSIVTPLNALLLGPELEYVLNDAGAKVLIADGERLDRLRVHLPSCPAIEQVFVTRPTGQVPQGVELLADIIGRWQTWPSLAAAALPDVEIQPDDDATIFFTSGTTGKPKGALATHRNIMGSLMAGSFNFARTLLRSGQTLSPPDPNAPQRANLLSLPLFNGNGCILQLLPGLVTGTKQVLMRKWEPEEAMLLIERERVTSAGGVPTLAWQLVEHPNRSKYDLSSLDMIGWGGAPSAPELVGKVNDALPRVGVGSGWGMTETSSGVTGHAGQDYAHRPDSAGVVFPAWEIKVVGPGDEALPPGEVGELWVKGPGVIKGYWNKPEATAETIVDGWLKTGDLVRLDAEGNLYVVDRAKDMLIRGGQNIYSVEIENVLYGHPDVIDAAIVPIPHRTLGETVGAVVFVQKTSRLTEQVLRDFAAQRLAKYKVPDRVVFWPEPLPRNASGKILKRELRAAFLKAIE